MSLGFPKSVIRLVLASSLILFPTFLAAAGPDSLPPTGASVIDTDTGSGESWARTGGRNISWSVNDLAAYDSLLWGAIAGAPPTAAFDGAVTPGTTEIMSFNSGGSSLGAGVAQWNGAALVTLQFPSTTTPIQTRFTLTVTRTDGFPQPLTFVGGTVSPGIDVLASGAFRANMLFEAFFPGSLGGTNSWRPLLEVYDALHTSPGFPPGAGGPALTAFSHGFYHELGAGGGTPGLSLEDHDLNITSRLADIQSDTAFLKIDTVGRFQGVQTGIDELRNQVGLLPTEFPTIPPLPDNIASREDVERVGVDVERLSDDLEQAKLELSNTLLILFGLAPCPENPDAPELCETTIFVQDLATQASVNSVAGAVSDLEDQVDALQAAIGASSSAMVVEVIEVPDPPSPKHRRWIVKTTLNGALVNAELSRIVSIRSNKLLPAVLEDVTHESTVMAIGPGLLDVSLNVGAGNGETILYQIEVDYTGSGSPLEASALISTGAR